METGYGSRRRSIGTGFGWGGCRPAPGPRIAIAALASLAAIAMVLAPPAAGEERRVRGLSGDFATAGIDRVELRLPIASVRIEPSPDDRLRVDLEARCTLDHEDCEEHAQDVSLRSVRDGSALRVRVEGMGSWGGLRLKLRGRILVPTGKALDIDLAVGELEVRNLSGDLDVDVGCGEVRLALREQDVHSVRMGVGIGEAALSVAGRHIEGEGWLGQKVHWGEGAGTSRVGVNVGVGELTVKLN